MAIKGYHPGIFMDLPTPWEGKQPRYKSKTAFFTSSEGTSTCPKWPHWHGCQHKMCYTWDAKTKPWGSGVRTTQVDLIIELYVWFPKFLPWLCRFFQAVHVDLASVPSADFPELKSPNQAGYKKCMDQLLWIDIIVRSLPDSRSVINSSTSLKAPMLDPCPWYVSTNPQLIPFA